MDRVVLPVVVRSREAWLTGLLVRSEEEQTALLELEAARMICWVWEVVAAVVVLVFHVLLSVS